MSNYQSILLDVTIDIDNSHIHPLQMASGSRYIFFLQIYKITFMIFYIFLTNEIALKKKTDQCLNLSQWKSPGMDDATSHVNITIWTLWRLLLGLLLYGNRNFAYTHCRMNLGVPFRFCDFQFKLTLFYFTNGKLFFKI